MNFSTCGELLPHVSFYLKLDLIKKETGTGFSIFFKAK